MATPWIWDDGGWANACIDPHAHLGLRPLPEPGWFPSMALITASVRRCDCHCGWGWSASPWPPWPAVPRSPRGLTRGANSAASHIQQAAPDAQTDLGVSCEGGCTARTPLGIKTPLAPAVPHLSRLGMCAFAPLHLQAGVIDTPCPLYSRMCRLVIVSSVTVCTRI